jgi:hypothetical protein
VDLVQIAQQLGISLPPEGMGGGFGAGGLSEEQRAAMQAARESGQFPGGEMGPGGGIGPGGMGGGFPGGNMPPPPDSEFSGGRMPEAAQPQAASGPRLVPEASMGINPGLLVVVIQFLEQRANQDR